MKKVSPRFSGFPQALLDQRLLGGGEALPECRLRLRSAVGWAVAAKRSFSRCSAMQVHSIYGACLKATVTFDRAELGEQRLF